MKLRFVGATWSTKWGLPWPCPDGTLEVEDEKALQLLRDCPSEFARHEVCGTVTKAMPCANPEPGGRGGMSWTSLLGFVGIHLAGEGQ